MSTYTYRIGQELPAMTGNWYDKDGNLVALGTGYTLSAKVALATAPTTTLLTVASITGSSTAPSWTIDWSTTELATLTAAESGTMYVVHVIARRTSDSKDAYYGSVGNMPSFILFPALT